MHVAPTREREGDQRGIKSPNIFGGTADVAYSLADAKPPSDPQTDLDPTVAAEPVTLRPYQAEAVAALRAFRGHSVRC